ncbi:ribonuclease H-like domain-containing protein, partial [Lentinula edodes]
MEVSSVVIPQRVCKDTPPKIPLDIPIHHLEIDHLYQQTLKSAKEPSEALAEFYGSVYYHTNPISVYTDGSCLDNGEEFAVAGSGVCYGIESHKNMSRRVLGPGKPTNNRGEAYAVLLVLMEIDPRRTLVIYTDSTYVIKECCFYAGKHLSMGWKIPNGDLLKDMCSLLKHRLASTTFVWVKGHSGNPLNDKADALAKEAA